MLWDVCIFLLQYRVLVWDVPLHGIFFILFIDNVNINKIYYKWFNLFLWFQTYYVLGLVVAHTPDLFFYCITVNL